MLKNGAVVDAYGWTKAGQYREFVAPARIEIDDGVGCLYFGELEAALVVRISSDPTKFSIVGPARRICSSWDCVQPRGRCESSIWTDATITMETTVEEMISFLVPTFGHDDDLGVEPLAFRMPKIVSVTGLRNRTSV